MYKTITFIVFIAFNLMNAQVGIGVTNPDTNLHVGGDVLVQDDLNIGTLNTVTPTDEDFKLLTRVTNSTPVGEITVLDVNSLSVAPINTIDYHFTNISLDNLSDVNLQYDSAKYVVAISNFRYVGDAIQKTSAGGSKSIGHFVVRTFENGGTWHLEIKNRDLDLTPGDSVEYYITLIVYDKSYFRNLAPIVTDLGGSNSGTASSVPVLY
tara:strand:+ start:132967 stop:133593 length:627 start_codon:yes stop_codon:yes gene_type:complete